MNTPSSAALKTLIQCTIELSQFVINHRNLSDTIKDRIRCKIAYFQNYLDRPDVYEQNICIRLFNENRIFMEYLQNELYRSLNEVPSLNEIERWDIPRYRFKIDNRRRIVKYSGRVLSFFEITTIETSSYFDQGYPKEEITLYLNEENDNKIIRLNFDRVDVPHFKNFSSKLIKLKKNINL